MYIFLMIVHVVVCFVLIAVVLLQAGRGGGFSEMLGGSQPSSIFGTQTSAFMTRATEVCAILFIITSLSMGIISTQRGKSLMQKKVFSDALQKAAAAKTVPAGTKSEVEKAASNLKEDVKPADGKAAPAGQLINDAQQAADAAGQQVKEAEKAVDAVSPDAVKV